MICTCPKMKPFRWRTEWKLWGYEESIKTKKTWKIFFQVFFCGQWWIRTTEGESQLSYSQPHLATLVTAHSNMFSWASCRIRTNDPEITNHVLWPTELKRHLLFVCGCKGSNNILRCNSWRHFFSKGNEKNRPGKLSGGSSLHVTYIKLNQYLLPTVSQSIILHNAFKWSARRFW